MEGRRMPTPRDRLPTICRVVSNSEHCGQGGIVPSTNRCSESASGKVAVQARQCKFFKVPCKGMHRGVVSMEGVGAAGDSEGDCDPTGGDRFLGDFRCVGGGTPYDRPTFSSNESMFWV